MISNILDGHYPAYFHLIYYCFCCLRITGGTQYSSPSSRLDGVKVPEPASKDNPNINLTP